MTDALTSLKAASKDLGAAVVRRIAFFGIISLLLLTAAGFGLAAGWTVLAAHLNSVGASLVIAGSLAGVAGLAVVADALIRRRRNAKHIHAAATQRPPLAPLLVQTFVASLNAGRSLSAHRR